MTELATNLNPDDLRASAIQHHLPPFTDHRQLAEEGGPRIISRADGCYLWDTEGNRYLDGMAGLWCVNVGYGRKELAEVAYRQMLELPYYNTFFKTATPPSVTLSEKIAEVLPDHLNQIHFVGSGSEANDTIARLVRHYFNLIGKPSKKTFISRHNAYHGSTMAAASFGGMAGMHAQGDLPLPGFVHVMQPYWYGEGGDMSPEEFGLKAAKSVEDKILELGADNVAAFIGEPVQGAGGVIIPPATYWPEINRICKEHGVLLIADEVICGFGRTGNWFGLETFGIEADIVPMAKGLSSGYLPVGAVAVADHIAETIVEKGGEFAHGMTYSGHPVACAVAVENLRILHEEKLVETGARRSVRPSVGRAVHARRSSSRRRDPFGRPARSDRAGQGQVDTHQVRSARQGRRHLPRQVFRVGAGHARVRRHDGHVAAFRHNTGAN